MYIQTKLLALAITLIIGVGGFIFKRIFGLIDSLQVKVDDTYKKHEVDRLLDKIEKNQDSLHVKIDRRD